MIAPQVMNLMHRARSGHGRRRQQFGDPRL
jgi:hypothetical protein